MNPHCQRHDMCPTTETSIYAPPVVSCHAAKQAEVNKLSEYELNKWISINHSCAIFKDPTSTKRASNLIRSHPAGITWSNITHARGLIVTYNLYVIDSLQTWRINSLKRHASRSHFSSINACFCLHLPLSSSEEIEMQGNTEQDAFKSINANGTIAEWNLCRQISPAHQGKCS